MNQIEILNRIADLQVFIHIVKNQQIQISTHNINLELLVKMSDIARNWMSYNTTYSMQNFHFTF